MQFGNHKKCVKRVSNKQDFKTLKTYLHSIIFTYLLSYWNNNNLKEDNSQISIVETIQLVYMTWTLGVLK